MLTTAIIKPDPPSKPEKRKKKFGLWAKAMVTEISPAHYDVSLRSKTIAVCPTEERAKFIRDVVNRAIALEMKAHLDQEKNER